MHVAADAEQAPADRKGELVGLGGLAGRHVEGVAAADGQVHVHVDRQRVHRLRVLVLRGPEHGKLEEDAVEILPGVIVPGDVHPQLHARLHRHADGLGHADLGVGLRPGAHQPLGGRVEQLPPAEVDHDEMVHDVPGHRLAPGVDQIDAVAAEPAVHRPGEVLDRRIVRHAVVHHVVARHRRHVWKVVRAGRDCQLVSGRVDGHRDGGRRMRPNRTRQHRGEENRTPQHHASLRDRVVVIRATLRPRQTAVGPRNFLM